MFLSIQTSSLSADGDSFGLHPDLGKVATPHNKLYLSNKGYQIVFISHYLFKCLFVCLFALVNLFLFGYFIWQWLGCHHVLHFSLLPKNLTMINFTYSALPHEPWMCVCLMSVCVVLSDGLASLQGLFPSDPL